MKFEVGQKLYYVPREKYQGDPRWVTVEKVGRKWATIGPRLRIDIKTLAADGGEYMSPGRCYLSQEEHEAEKRMYFAWHSFGRFLNSRACPPEGVTIEAIMQAAALLGVPQDQMLK